MRLLPSIGLGLALLAPALRATEPGIPLAPLQRMAFARVLLPADPENRITSRLPQSRILSEAELESTYREMQQGSYLGVVGWKDLLVNFALRHRYAEARVSLALARKKEDFKTDAGLFDAWFIEQTGDFRAALAAYEELIPESPSELILQQRRTGCLAALYRPLATRQALDVVEAMAKDQTVWLEHLRGIIALLENDLDQAHVHFLQSIRHAGKTPYPHSAAGMAVLYRAGQSTEESVGWLKKAMTGVDPRFQEYLINQEIWKPLWSEPLFQEAAQTLKWPFFPDREGLAAGPSPVPTGGLYARNPLPEGYTQPLKLQEHQPGTRTRTLTGKLNLDLYHKEE